MKSIKPFNKNLIKKPINTLAFCTVSTVLSFASVGLANAAVTLNVDENIRVTAINGQAVNSSLLQENQKRFTLQPGQHVITAKYERLYDLNKHDHDFLRSGNITLSAQLADNQSYQLVMPNQPERYAEAKKYVKNPTLAIKQGSATIASQNGSNSADTGLFSSIGKSFGGLFGSNAVQSNTQAIAAINQGNSNTVPATATNNPTPTANQSPVVANGSTLDQFMQIWLKATPEERERIRGWVVK